MEYDLHITIKGVPKSGKSRAGVLIEAALRNQGASVVNDDPDAPPEFRNLSMENIRTKITYEQLRRNDG